MLLAAILGFVIGFVGSIPIAGPVAALVLRRGLEDRARSARFLAAGAAIVESAYAYLAFWGFSAFLAKHAWMVPASRGAATVILAALGVMFMRKRTHPDAPPMADPNVGNKRSFFLGVTVTALNPTLIVTWTGAVTFVYSLDVVHFDERSALPFSVGAMLGITIWFTLMLELLGRFRARVSTAGVDRVIRYTGAFLLALAAYFAFSFARAMGWV
jgi:threonine/homoserine/homoserine lactone efflux protein